MTQKKKIWGLRKDMPETEVDLTAPESTEQERSSAPETQPEAAESKPAPEAEPVARAEFDQLKRNTKS